MLKADRLCVLPPNPTPATPHLPVTAAATQPQLTASVANGVASLQQYTLAFSEPTTISTIQQQDQDGACPSGVYVVQLACNGPGQGWALNVSAGGANACRLLLSPLCLQTLTPPSRLRKHQHPHATPLAVVAVGCLNMAMYQFAESTACVCTSAAAQSVRDLAKECNRTAVWALIAVAGLFAGAVFGCMELAADRAMLAADQLFLAVMKRKAGRWVGVVPSGRVMPSRAACCRFLDRRVLPACY